MSHGVGGGGGSQKCGKSVTYYLNGPLAGFTVGGRRLMRSRLMLQFSRCDQTDQD